MSEAEREALRARVASFCEAAHGNGVALARAASVPESFISAFKNRGQTIGLLRASAVAQALDALRAEHPSNGSVKDATRAALLEKATLAAQAADPEVSRLRRELAAAEERVASAVRALLGGEA